MKSNIVLIGMPGAGKSTVGVVLAKRLGLRFVDTDLIIQEKEGLLLQEIIRKKGCEGFIKTENDILKELELERTVIATGGSAIYGKEAMEHLGKTGIIIYLNQSLRGISLRLGDLKSRGVIFKEGQTLKEIFRERTPLYNKYADIIINCHRKTIGKTVRDIENRLREFKES